MLGFAVGKVTVDALILCLVLYLVARHDADYDFQKLTMVVAGTALGNVALSIGISGHLPARHVLWILPLVQMVFAAFMIKTFCWVSMGKALLVAFICGVLQLGSGLGMRFLMARLMNGAAPSASLVEQQERDLAEAKQTMEQMLAQSRVALAARSVPSPVPAAPTATGGVADVTAGASTAAQVMAVACASTGALVAVGDAEDWPAARKQLKVSGISGRAGEYVALINERIVRPGDTVSVALGKHTYYWSVRQITRDHLDLDPRGVR